MWSILVNVLCGPKERCNLQLLSKLVYRCLLCTAAWWHCELSYVFTNFLPDKSSYRGVEVCNSGLIYFLLHFYQFLPYVVWGFVFVVRHIHIRVFGILTLCHYVMLLLSLITFLVLKLFLYSHLLLISVSMLYFCLFL
jgi:hypothetical protein